MFTIRFNPKSIATSSINLLTQPHASSEFTDSFSSWIYTNTSTLTCDFEIPLKGFKSPSVMILMQQLCSTKRLILVFTPVDSCVVWRYKTCQISQRVTHKSFQHIQNVARVSLSYVEKFRWNPKCFRRLGPI